MAPGIDLIAEFEGFRPHAYPDPIHGWEVPTIGFGTTKYSDGSRVKRGDSVTWAQAEAELSAHVAKVVMPELVKIPYWAKMNTNQRGALISFAYNLGAKFYRGEKFRSITRLIDSPDRWGDRDDVLATFQKYRNPGSSAERGLMRRRTAEAELFLTPED